MKVKQTKKKMGAPKKADGMKGTYDGLTNDQQSELRTIAIERGVTYNAIKRQAIGWYLKALRDAESRKTVNQELSLLDKEDMDLENIPV